MILENYACTALQQGPGALKKLQESIRRLEYGGSLFGEMPWRDEILAA